MSIRILGGSHKGLEIQVPHTNVVRPTSVMLRRRLFDSRQDLSGYHFIDLCAGSGAMGLEALSRGADSADFYESNSKVFAILKKNIQRFLIKENKPIAYTKGSFTKAFTKQNHASCIYFFDPPYEKLELYEEFLLKLEGLKGEIWIEGDRQKNYSQEDFEAKFGRVSKFFTQGTSYIAILDRT
jgi:16S rRNA (guanine966-N2)-methyltransferase